MWTGLTTSSVNWTLLQCKYFIAKTSSSVKLKLKSTLFDILKILEIILFEAKQQITAKYHRLTQGIDRKDFLLSV